MTPEDGDAVWLPSEGDHLWLVAVQPWGYTGTDFFDASQKRNWTAADLEAAEVWRKVPEQS